MSWRLKVRHTTGYAYAGEVTSSYNEARLVPQTGLTQMTLESRVVTSPSARQQRYWDYWGTQVTAFDVHEPHTSLEVTATSVVDTADPVPPPATGVDWSVLAMDAVRDTHVEQLAASPRAAPDEELAALAAEAAARLSPYDAAVHLLGAVHDTVVHQPGTTGVATTATEAWALRQGVCQDIAHVSIALLRAAGLPARYVSGYLHPGGDAAEVGVTVKGESHAWVEVWLGGWWGWDPTNDRPQGEQHVVVARGRDYGDVPPLKGVYAGGGAQSLGVTVEVTRLR